MILLFYQWFSPRHRGAPAVIKCFFCRKDKPFCLKTKNISNKKFLVLLAGQISFLYLSRKKKPLMGCCPSRAAS